LSTLQGLENNAAAVRKTSVMLSVYLLIYYFQLRLKKYFTPTEILKATLLSVVLIQNTIRDTINIIAGTGVLFLTSGELGLRKMCKL